MFFLEMGPACVGIVGAWVPHGSIITNTATAHETLFVYYVGVFFLSRLLADFSFLVDFIFRMLFEDC